VRVHPTNPDVVYVAALGHAHGPNEQRGLFRSQDGGKTWDRILYINENVGVHDLSMDPNNPRILYAVAYAARRIPHQLISGGEGCGIYKSINGGDTWTEITRNKGLPTGPVGKIGVAVSPALTDRVYAIVESKDSAVYRSDNGGDTWERLSDDHDISGRPWYYMHIIADPQDPNTVWVLNTRCYRTIDGGRTFQQVAVPHGDNHDLWIDPANPHRVILGNDGGATVSYDGGETWTSLYNQPTAEFYHVTTDNQTPYRVYGPQQDNTTASIPSRSYQSAIVGSELMEVGGGESGYIAVRSDNPNIIYAGSYQGYLTRYDVSTGQQRDITVWPEPSMGSPASDLKYRFQWTSPTVLSPHDPNVLYTAGNHVFRSTDEGASWEEISPDLTRHDPSTLGPSGGPITGDNVGTEYYATVFAFAESPRQRGVFWAGSDDGLIHVSRDGGASWQNVTPPDLPVWALISIIEPSPHDPATAYVAANRYKLDDFHPSLYKTNDYGATWTKNTDGIADNDFTRAIREDPERRGLLFAGTETGVHVSFDDGAHWQPLKLNLPVVPVHDLTIKDSDLIAATHGRAFWVLDDIGPLRQMADELREAPAHLFAPRPAIRYTQAGGFGGTSAPGKNYAFSGAFILAYREKELPTGEKTQVYLDAGQNPPNGLVVQYYLKEKPEGEVTLTFLDAEGKEIKRFSSEEQKPAATGVTGATAAEGAAAGEPKSPTAEEPAEKKDETKGEKKEPRVPKNAGGNRLVWNLRYPDSVKIEGYVAGEDALNGPVAAPGRYQLRLQVGDQTYTQPFEVRKDPRIPDSDEDLRAQFDLLIAIRDRLSEVHEAINAIRSIRKQTEEWESRTKGHEIQDKVAAAAKALRDKLLSIEGELTQVKAKVRSDTMDHPIKLNAKVAALASVVSSGEAAPTRQSRQVFDDLSARVAAQIQRLRELVDTDVAAFNTLIREASIPAIVPSAPSKDRAKEPVAQPATGGGA
ncbi:MAG: VPS10 domain-containing protein, partial [Ktedonobacterales bacterium]